MRSLFILICSAVLLCIIIPNLHSQSKLWGILPTNGTTESGSVFQIELDGSDLTSIKDFVFANCGRPRGNVLYANNGKVYGIAEGGFGNFNSIIYEYDPSNGSFEFVYSFFDPSTGTGEYAMECALIQHSNGKVYGMTQHGGDNNDGQLFEFNLQTKELVIKIHFESATKGKIPIGALTEASDGRLYGVTAEGGTHDLGVLYVYDPATNLFAGLKHFDGPGIGATPLNGPLQTPNGKLIGLTRTGGINDLGVVYEYDIASNLIAKKHDFDGTNTGAHPYDKFCLATNGMYYATTSSGGNSDNGVIVEFDQSSGVLTKKYDFNGTSGRYPTGALVEYSDGYLYGKATHGGIESKGVLFKYEPGSSAYTKLLDFYDEYGEYAYNGLTISPQGKLLGITWQGGLGNHGVLFEYNPPTGIYQQLIHFRYTETGGLPHCALMRASDGMVYGTTTAGGTSGSGVIFRIDPSDRSFEKVFDFGFVNLGGGCKDGLIQASNGMLYGLASYGGANIDGVLFAFDPSTLQYTILHNFDEIVSGSYPVGKLVQGSNGNLYGITERGGVNGDGVLFEYTMSTQTFVLLHEFNDPVSGSYPTGVMQAANGKLYGTTQRGGAYNLGVLFEYDLVSYSFSVKVDFDNLNKGALPMGVLLEYSDNQLYGLTGHGGSDASGVLYHFNTTNSLFTKIKNFMNNDDGYSPYCSLMKTSNGLIYGTNSMGGPQDYGVIFSFDPLGGDYSVIHSFGQFGDRPVYGSLLEVETDYGIKENEENLEIKMYPNPAREQVHISIPEADGKIQLKIYDIGGKLLLDKEISGLPGGSFEYTIDLNTFNSGIYNLIVYSGSGTGHKKLLVK